MLPEYNDGNMASVTIGYIRNTAHRWTSEGDWTCEGVTVNLGYALRPGSKSLNRWTGWTLKLPTALN